MSAGAQNGIVGDDAGYGLDIPEYQAEEDEALRELSKSARFSRTAEFQALKEKLASRIEYYKGYQPGGNGADIAIKDLSNDERGWRWLAADLVISEFSAVIKAYEMAYQQVKDESTKRATAKSKTT